jgi:hypothetical protein
MPIVGFNSIPASNDTGFPLYVFGCEESGDLPVGGANVLTGASPGVGCMNPPEGYYWVLPDDLEINPTQWVQFTVCTPANIIMEVYTPGGQAPEQIELTPAPAQKGSVSEEMEAALARFGGVEPNSDAQ